MVAASEADTQALRQFAADQRTSGVQTQVHHYLGVGVGLGLRPVGRGGALRLSLASRRPHSAGGVWFSAGADAASAPRVSGDETGRSAKPVLREGSWLRMQVTA